MVNGVSYFPRITNFIFSDFNLTAKPTSNICPLQYLIELIRPLKNQLPRSRASGVSLEKRKPFKRSKLQKIKPEEIKKIIEMESTVSPLTRKKKFHTEQKAFCFYQSLILH